MPLLLCSQHSAVLASWPHVLATCSPASQATSAPTPWINQGYIRSAHALRDELEHRVREACVEEPIPTPTNLPWFDLLSHPAA